MQWLSKSDPKLKMPFEAICCGFYVHLYGHVGAYQKKKTGLEKDFAFTKLRPFFVAIIVTVQQN